MKVCALVTEYRLVSIGQNHAQVMANWPDRLPILEASLSLVSHTSRFVQCTIQCRFTIFTLVRHRLPTEVGTRTLSRLQVSGSPVQWNGDYWTGEPITWNESSQLPVVVERIHQDIPEGSCADFSHGGAAPTTLRVAPVRGWSGMKPQQSNYSNHPSRVSRTANGITIR